MHNSFHTETVETDAGPYTVELFFDDDSSSPLADWDNPGTVFYVQWSARGGRWDDAVDTLDGTNFDGERYAPADAVNALRTWIGEGHSPDEIERRYRLWRNMFGSPWALVVGSDSASQSDWYRWFALVDTTERFGPDGPVAAVEAIMATYNQFASGMVTAYEVTSPDGEVLESVGGFYEDDEALAEARAVAESDAAERVDRANLAGAGFKGLI